MMLGGVGSPVVPMVTVLLFGSIVRVVVPVAVGLACAAGGVAVQVVVGLRGPVVRVAGDALGDGRSAGGVSGGGALGDVGGKGVACDGPGDVGDGNGELAMPMRGVFFGTQRVAAVGYALAGGGAGGVVGEGAVGSNR